MILISHLWGLFQDYFPNQIKLIAVKRSSVELVIAPKKIVPMLKLLKRWSSTKFSCLVDIVVIDFLKTQKARYRVIYILENYKSGLRCLVNTNISDNLQLISSATSIYKNANWCEREIYDMFGIQFSNHPRLTRILTDYGFIGHPLRKDFPLVGPINGKTVVRKGETTWVLRGLVDVDDEK